MLALPCVLHQPPIQPFVQNQCLAHAHPTSQPIECMKIRIECTNWNELDPTLNASKDAKTQLPHMLETIPSHRNRECSSLLCLQHQPASLCHCNALQALIMNYRADAVRWLAVLTQTHLIMHLHISIWHDFILYHYILFSAIEALHGTPSRISWVCRGQSIHTCSGQNLNLSDTTDSN